MGQIFVAISAVLFLVMGVAGLVKPSVVTRLFSLPAPPSALRNEVRAVYGGFGLAVAGMLGASSVVSSIRPGVLLTVAVFLLGMVAGRLVSWVADRKIDRYPLLFMGLECLLAALLFYAWRAG